MLAQNDTRRPCFRRIRLLSDRAKAKLIEALSKCHETLQILYMCYEGCPCKKSSENSIPKVTLPQNDTRRPCSVENSNLIEALSKCYETLQILYMCYEGCPCKKSSANSIPKVTLPQNDTRRPCFRRIRLLSDRAKAKSIEALSKCYETFQILYMCYEGCPCKKSSANSIPKVTLPPFPFSQIRRLENS